MAITFNDNLNVSATKPVDRRYGPYNGTSINAAISAANAATVAGERYIGLTVGLTVNFGPVKEYWYAAGVTNNDLVEKTSSVSGAGNGLTNTNGTIGLGGTLTTPTVITTSATNTLTLQGLQTTASPTHYVSADSNGVLTLSTISSLTSTVQTSILSALTANNGLTKTGSNIQLGGTLTQNTSIPLSDYFITIFNNTNATNRSESTFNRSAVNFDTYDSITGTPDVPTNDGSRSRIISTKASSAMWTTNYLYNSTHNPAYRAWENWLTDHPWIVPASVPAGVPFQILENLQGTNRDSAVQAHYFDERVGNPLWIDTWTNPVNPNAYGSTFPGWVPGKTYTLRILDGIDDFTGIAATTLDGTPYTSGWVFTYTSGGPTLWLTSTVDGDFPIQEQDQRTSLVLTSEGRDSGDAYNYQKGVVNILGKTVFVTGRIDQIASTGGIRLAQTAGTNTATLPTISESTIGEMFYSTALQKIVVRVAASGGSQWISLDSTAI
jgi:hypothetical protein